MRFGSVEFFKVLIKTVLVIAFFLPLILCVIFGVFLWNAKSDLKEVKQENERLAFAAEILTGERAGDVESFYELYKNSGNSDEALIAYIAEKNGGQPDVPKADVNTSDEQTSEPAPQTSGTAPAQTSSTPDSSEPQPTESELETIETVEPQAPESAYALIHQDMRVPMPASYVRETGTVYLTFDDGPSDNTYSILGYLEKYNIKATFFVVPSRTDYCYELLQKIVADGHSIGVHSATHDYHQIYGSVEAFLEDFYEAWDIIYDATGVRTQIYRFPGGSKNDFNEETREAIIEEMTRRGFRHYDWNVDSNDAGGAGWSEMYNSIPSDVANTSRAIVLMHDSAPRTNTVWVFEDVLKVLIGEGYKFDKINNDTLPIQFIGPHA